MKKEVTPKVDNSTYWITIGAIDFSLHGYPVVKKRKTSDGTQGTVFISSNA